MRGSRFPSSVALLGLVFIILGFTDGWESAAFQCLVLAYWLSLVCLVAFAALAASLRELRTDRSLWMLAALAVALGLAHYLLLGWRPLYYASLLGIACGAIIGLGIRFGNWMRGRRQEP